MSELSFYRCDNGVLILNDQCIPCNDLIVIAESPQRAADTAETKIAAQYLVDHTNLNWGDVQFWWHKEPTVTIIRLVSEAEKMQAAGYPMLPWMGEL